MLVESYALETVWSLVALVLSAANNPSCVFLIQTDPIIKVGLGSLTLSTLLIIGLSYRALRTFLFSIEFLVGMGGPSRRRVALLVCNGSIARKPKLPRSCPNPSSEAQFHLCCGDPRGSHGIFASTIQGHNNEMFTMWRYHP